MIAQLRDLTRYRKKLVEDRAKEVQRVQKVLEDAGIKLESVVTDVMGKAAAACSKRSSPENGPRCPGRHGLDPGAAAHPQLRHALPGRFNEHHALMISMHLAHIDHLSAGTDRLDTEVDRVVVPFSTRYAGL